MDTLYDVQITDYQKAQEVAAKVRLGHAFAFLDGAVAIEDGGAGARRRRLQIEPQAGGRRVVALVGEPVSLPGARITPQPWSVDRIAGLSTDRDLYRAENDTVYFHAAFASPPANAAVVLSCNGSHLLRRELEVVGGMAIEPVAMLLAGQYEATLEIDGREQGAPVRFTVAEFSLAPIAARLVDHQLERASGTLSFTLAVESYQQPLERKIVVALVEGGYEVTNVELEPESAGLYRGRLAGADSTEGALRLRVTLAGDAARVTEVAVPGSRRSERETTCVNELGREQLFCVLPEPGAIATHGGYLSDGQFFDTPVAAEGVLTASPTLTLNKAVESMVLVIHDLASGATTVREIGAREAGACVPVETGATAACVFVGAWIDGQPFEAFTTFLRPRAFDLGVEVLATPEPGGVLRLALTASGAPGPLRMLLCIRDARLTQADRPALALGASLKRGTASLTEPMLERELSTLNEYLRVEPEYVILGDDEIAYLEDVEFDGMVAGAGQDYGGLEEVTVRSAFGEAVQALPVVRSEFPQVLFFAALDVDTRTELSISLGDALTTYVIEAFAVHDGTWCEAQDTVVIDQPLRVDLDLPPFVNEGDSARGTLRADSLGRVGWSLCSAMVSR